MNDLACSIAEAKLANFPDDGTFYVKRLDNKKLLNALANENEVVMIANTGKSQAVILDKGIIFKEK